MDYTNTKIFSRIILNSLQMDKLLQIDHEMKNISSAVNPNKLNCPTIPEIEPNSFFVLSGRNEVPLVEAWGWTNSIVTGFPGLKQSLTMRVEPLSTAGELSQEFEEVKMSCETLDRLYKSADLNHYKPLLAPVLVTVVAKKKVDFIVMKSIRPPRVLVIGNLMIADNSGVCICTLFNEMTELVHNNVEVGDRLLIVKGSYKEYNYNKGHIKFPYKNHQLSVEIKIDKYQVRHITKIRFEGMTKFIKMPLNDQTMWIGSPSMLLLELTDHYKKSGIIPDYVDLIGVVSYVGRIERYGAFESEISYQERSDENLFVGKVSTKLFRQYVAYRWIEVVDKTSPPLKIKLLMTKDMLQKGESLLPGSCIILTKTTVVPASKLEQYVMTSVFTDTYLTNDIPKYFQLTPKEQVKKVITVLSLSEYLETIKRIDLTMSAGGTINPLIHCPKMFAKDFDQRCIPFSTANLQRRESMALSFRGTVQRVELVDSKSNLTHDYHLTNTPHEAFFKTIKDGNETDKWPVFRSRSYCACEKCNIKYCTSDRRKLPIPRIEPEGLITTRETVAKITKEYQTLCGPLLMPSTEYISGRKLYDCPRLNNLKSPFLRVLLRDNLRKQWFDVDFKTFTFDVSRDKITKAEGKTILCILDICRWDDNDYEILLRDFVID